MVSKNSSGEIEKEKTSRYRVPCHAYDSPFSCVLFVMCVMCVSVAKQRDAIKISYVHMEMCVLY